MHTPYYTAVIYHKLSRIKNLYVSLERTGVTLLTMA